jgi:amidohydrolase
MLDYVTQTRRALHQIPELGFDLLMTSAFVQAQLRSFGYEPLIMAKTGVIAVKKGLSDQAIAFRADMDALPVFEQTTHDFQSTHPGKMHACGHDGHMTMLLGFAKSVADRPPFNHTLVFIFQPAEEGPGGAKVLIEEGLFQRFNIQSIFGIHLFPGLPEGTLGITAGPLMASAMEFTVTIRGKSAHAAQPHEGLDAIVAASQVIQAYQTIISRNRDPLDTAVLTIGSIQGGEAPNIIAREVVLKGTVRGFDPALMAMIKQRMIEINTGLSQATQTDITAHLIDAYPAVINDEQLAQTVSSGISLPQAPLKPKMFAEDFSYYQQLIPGLFVFLGTNDDSGMLGFPLHSCYFNFNESVLLKGIDYYTQVLELMD